MNRRHFTFTCDGALCAATLDDASDQTGLLIVSGGNELRSGAWNGQALLAARIAAAGHPVLRFDRRGAGDSEGANLGFRSGAPDIAAALDAFRSEAPQLSRIFAFGNCDAASALMLCEGAGCDGLILSNPWTFEDEAEDAAPPAAVRAHYAQRLRDPRAILRLLKGQVSIGGLLASLRSALRPAPPPSSLAEAMARGLSRFSGPAAILLAGRDRTAMAFEAGWDRSDPRIRRCPQASHSYVEAQDWLTAQVLEAMRQNQE